MLVIDAYVSPRPKCAAQLENLNWMASAGSAHLQGPRLALAQEACLEFRSDTAKPLLGLPGK